MSPLLIVLSALLGLSLCLASHQIYQILKHRHRLYLENLVFDRLLEVIPLLVTELQKQVVRVLLQDQAVPSRQEMD